jgi:predicted phage-related endonuclease
MTNLTATIDAYAELKVQISGLERKKKELEAALADLKAGSYESADYRLTISDVVGSKPDDKLAAEIKAVLKAAEADYRATLSSQYLTAHTVPTLVRRHLVGLPTGKNLAA